MRQFEWRCMIAALTNLGLVIVGLLCIFNHDLADNAAAPSPTGLLTADMIFIGVGVGTLLAMSPFMSMPYWLGLLIVRRHGEPSQVFFYIYCGLFFFSSWVMFRHRGMTYESCVSVLEIIILVVVMVLMNDTTSRNWITAGPR